MEGAGGEKNQYAMQWRWQIEQVYREKEKKINMAFLAIRLQKPGKQMLTFTHSNTTSGLLEFVIDSFTVLTEESRYLDSCLTLGRMAPLPESRSNRAVKTLGGRNNSHRSCGQTRQL